MRKIPMFLVVFLLLANVVFAEGGISEQDAAGVLADYGIIHGDPDGNLRLTDTITRAEFAKVIVETASVDGLSEPCVFEDVPVEHWAYDYIAAAYKSGIVAGMTKTVFEPDSPVTNEQAVKMIVCALGYGEKAEMTGGFPFAYMKLADELGILCGLDVTGGAFASRGTVIRMVYNALEIPLMQEVISDETVALVIMNGEGDCPLVTFGTLLRENLTIG